MDGETKITVAAAIKGLTLILTIVFGYFTLQAQVEAHNAAQDDRINTLETKIVDAKLSEIPVTLSRIEEKVTRLEKEQRK